MQYQRILCLGDSITYGARARFGETYPVILERQLAELQVPSICINAGVNGERSYEIVERAWSYLGSDDWIRICICLMGTNDSKPGARTPMDTYLSQWARLKRMCDVTDTRLLAVEIPYIDPVAQIEYDANSSAWLRDANEAVQSWCMANSVPRAYGLWPMFQAHPEQLLDDGIHPNNHGNQVIADTLYGMLRRPWSGSHVPSMGTNGHAHVQRLDPLVTAP